ncbi:MAG: DUF6665 family protein [Xanthobacteraceae bacterium]
MSSPQASKTSSHIAALDYEIVQEQASALGRLGRALETALAALVQHDRLHGDNHGDLKWAAKRRRLVQDAGNALWCFMVQREACGLRDPRPVLRDYRVPIEVQNRMGIFTAQRIGPA